MQIITDTTLNQLKDAINKQFMPLFNRRMQLINQTTPLKDQQMPTRQKTQNATITNKYKTMQQNAKKLLGQHEDKETAWELLSSTSFRGIMKIEEQ